MNPTNIDAHRTTSFRVELCRDSALASTTNCGFCSGAMCSCGTRRRHQRRNNRPLLLRQVARVPQMIAIVSRSTLLRPHRQPPANQTASFESQMIPTTPQGMLWIIDRPGSIPAAGNHAMRSGRARRVNSTVQLSPGAASAAQHPFSRPPKRSFLRYPHRYCCAPTR